MSDSVWPQRWQPTRLPHPWDSPGKNTGVGCHFLLQCCFLLLMLLLLLSRFSRVRLCATPWTAAYQASPSMGFSRQEHWSGLPFPSPMHECGKWKWSRSVVSDSFFFFNFTILYWFCHISKWICHRYTCVPHPEPSSLLPPHTVPLGCPSAPAPSIPYSASNLDWRLISYMILYMFQCHSPKSSHPLPLPRSPQDCCIHQETLNSDWSPRSSVRHPQNTSVIL